MKILLFGAAGQLGSELHGALGPAHEVIALSRTHVDFCDFRAVRDAIREANPAMIINASAYTNVDGAETEPGLAHAVNADAVGVLGEEATRRRAALVHFSTDFVFDGTNTRPYLESDVPRPINAYGRTKWEGEVLLMGQEAPAVILRTSWVWSPRTKNFVTSVLRAARNAAPLRVVRDQVGSPTLAGDLARGVSELVRNIGHDGYERFLENRGIYHVAGHGYASRFDLAFAALSADPCGDEHRFREIVPVSSEEFPAPAKRPAFAPLDCGKVERTFGIRLPPWREAVSRAFD